MNQSTRRSPNGRADRPVDAPAPVSYVRRLVSGTCVRYTAISTMAILINLILGDTEGAYIDPLRFLLFLPFALCLALATAVRKTEKMPTAGKLVLHPVLSLGGFYLCLYLPFQIRTSPTGTQILLLLLLSALVYGLLMVIIALCTRRARRRQIEEKPYVSQFGIK